MAVHQGVAHGEVLGQTDQGVVHALIAVGVVPAQHIAHAGGGLFKGLVRGEAVLVHGVEDPAVDRLETVPHIRQGTALDDAHGVFNVGFLHLRDQEGCDDLLVRKTDLLRIILGFFRHI